MRTIINLISLIALVLLVCLVLFAAGLLLMGLGWGLSKVFPVTVFQGSVVITAVALMLVLYLGLLQVKEALHDIRQCLTSSTWDWLEDEEDEGEDDADVGWDEETDENGDGFDRERGVPFADPSEARRNSPCPCGSGRKYKNCCGRGETN
ncbi:MAG: SEC-C metal-binding domain-containing protein [Abditibacteriales bacterium]|nr:SEC-C metal-binding domain-containing protein [Abditibacteriales bacterium]MDW8366977.1 SEC-C metal-binding domain-containing protein [Abditibacteriales bacterium]